MPRYDFISTAQRKAADPENPGPMWAGMNIGMVYQCRDENGSTVTAPATLYPVGGFEVMFRYWDDTWPYWVKPSIDYGLKMGCNIFRLFAPMASVYASERGISYPYAITKAQALERYAQYMDYCASQGAYVYLSIGSQLMTPTADQVGTTLYNNRDTWCDFARDLARLARYRGNVIGCDVIQEINLFNQIPSDNSVFPNGHNFTDPQILQTLIDMKAAVLEGFPEVQITFSYGGGSGAVGTMQADNAREYLSDYRDGHQYISDANLDAGLLNVNSYEFIHDNDPSVPERPRDSIFYISGESGRPGRSAGSTFNSLDDDKSLHYRRWIAQFEEPASVTGSERLCGGMFWTFFHHQTTTTELYGICNLSSTASIQTALETEAAARVAGTYNDIWDGGWTETKGNAIRAGSLVPTTGTIDASLYPKTVGVLSDWMRRQAYPNNPGIARFISHKARRGTTRLATKLAPWKSEVVL